MTLLPSCHSHSKKACQPTYFVIDFVNEINTTEKTIRAFYNIYFVWIRVHLTSSSICLAGVKMAF